MSLLIPTTPPVDTPSRGFDEYLGTAQDRYLGDGHRRVTFEMSEPTQIGAGEFSSIARVSYPDDWSQKAGMRRDPHLSTVDAIRIAGAVRSSLSGGVLLAGCGDERSLTVRAGARPWEQLDAVPVRTTVTALPDKDSVVLKHKIGSLQVESRLALATEALAVDEAWEPGTVSDVRFDDASRVECMYERRSPRPSLLSFLEAMMLTAQMSQVALYGGDPDARNRSGNMWMRRAHFVRHTSRPFRTGVVELQLQNRRDVTIGDRVIGTADVVAVDVFGVQVTASLATGS